MKKPIYLNMKTSEGVETIDEFTQGEDAPSNPKEFRAYVRAIVQEYRSTGQPVYTSSRCTKDWSNK